MSVIEQSFAVLSMVNEFNRIEGRTRFQKLVFLLDKDNSVGFGFEKSNYGPFSSRLCDIIENMTNDSWMVEKVIEKEEKKKYIYKITGKGKEQLELMKEFFEGSKINMKIQKWIESVKSKEFNKINLVELVKFIYDKYPKFAGDFFKNQ